jgi:hypothetical protein
VVGEDDVAGDPLPGPDHDRVVHEVVGVHQTRTPAERLEKSPIVNVRSRPPATEQQGGDVRPIPNLNARREVAIVVDNRVLSDDECSSTQIRTFGETIAMRGIAWTNGKAEARIKTPPAPAGLPRPLPHQQPRARALIGFMRCYNHTDRTSSLSRQPPISRVPPPWSVKLARRKEG